MDLSKLTQKSQEALHAAQAIGVRHGHQEVDGEHPLVALLNQENGLVPRIVARMGAGCEALCNAVEQEIGRRPRVSGPGAEQGKLYVTQRLQKLLLAAQDEAQRVRDEFVSVEHLFLALVSEGESTDLGRVLRKFGITRDRALETLSQVRGNQRVTSDNPEASYEALEKYGMDLVAEARKGRLDPVIGRDDEIRRVVRILSRKTKNNPVLIGEPGVGKTAIVEGLAQRIVREDVPDWLIHLSGAHGRGQNGTCARPCGSPV